MTEFEQDLRHKCRNPRCRMNLPAPVSNPREAFCTRGCHTSFYLHRCLVCEGPLERKREAQKVCRKAQCRSAWQGKGGFGRYVASSPANKAQETPNACGSAGASKPVERPLWRLAAAGAPVSANAYHCAIVGADFAMVEADRSNAAHWRAAAKGERGYRAVPSPGGSRREPSRTLHDRGGRVDPRPQAPQHPGHGSAR
jgi:hypothetical protein